MATEYSSQINNLFTAIESHSRDHGAAFIQAVHENSMPLLEGLDFLRTAEATGTADVLLNGSQAAIIEVAGCLSVGFVRPALFSLRAQMDMLLAWLYFKDHAIEWRYLEETGNGFKMKRYIIQYLNDYIPGFGERFSVLLLEAKRREEDPYRLLSAHVHSQSPFSSPVIGPLDSLVRAKSLCGEAVVLQGEVSEYLCDVLLACYGPRWASIPDMIVNAAKARLTNPQQKVVFA